MTQAQKDAARTAQIATTLAGVFSGNNIKAATNIIDTAMYGPPLTPEQKARIEKSK